MGSVRVVMVVVAVLMAMVSCQRGGHNANATQLERMRIAIEHPADGISVLSGAGRVMLEKLTSRSSSVQEELFKSAYFAPDVSPRLDEMICVRCEGVPIDPLNRRHVHACVLVVVALATGEEKVLFSPDEGDLIDSPVFSPDGGRIAFFVGRDIGILSRLNGEFLHRYEALKPRRAEPQYAAIRTDYIRWADDGRRIFMVMTAPASSKEIFTEITSFQGVWSPTDIGEFELASGKLSWLGMRDVRFVYGRYVPPLVQKEGRLEAIREDLPDVPAVRAVLGSTRNPVRMPIWSPDREYYFYLRMKEGLFASAWLEGYEVSSMKSFRVRTLWRALYTE